MKLILPKEHGAWAMWITPFIIGIFVTHFSIFHLPLLISIFFAYISISPFIQGIKRPSNRKQLWKYSVFYIIIAILFGLPVIIIFPKVVFIVLAIIPLFLLNLYFVKQKKERALLNDLFAIAALSSTIFASYYIGSNKIDSLNLILWIYNIFFFFGSALYVKSLIRERNNKTFKILSKLYSIIVPIFGFHFSGIYLLFAFTFFTIRIFIPYKANITSKTIGIIEIFNTLWFTVFIILSV